MAPLQDVTLASLDGERGLLAMFNDWESSCEARFSSPNVVKACEENLSCWSCSVNGRRASSSWPAHPAGLKNLIFSSSQTDTNSFLRVSAIESWLRCRFQCIHLIKVYPCSPKSWRKFGAGSLTATSNKATTFQAIGSFLCHLRRLHWNLFSTKFSSW